MLCAGARISYSPDSAEGEVCDGTCVSDDCATAPSKLNLVDIIRYGLYVINNIGKNFVRKRNIISNHVFLINVL